MKKLFILFSMFLSILFQCCCSSIFPDREYSIHIHNESEFAISYYADYIYPDTTLNDTFPSNMKTVQVGQFSSLNGFEVGDDEFKRFKSEKLTIFIFKSDLIQAAIWDTIRYNYLIYNRFEIIESDLEEGGILTVE